MAFSILIYINYRDVFELVSIDKIYELRSENSQVINVPFIGYITMWYLFIFIPLSVLSFMKKRSLFNFLKMVFSVLLIYGATGAKLGFRIVIIIFFLTYVAKKPLFNYLLFSLGLISIILTLLPDGLVSNFARSIYFVRLLGISGWTFVAYYDFFSVYGFTYGSHIGFMNSIFEYYPYDSQYEIGQLIGDHYHGSYKSNPNANYLVSDGVAGFGVGSLFFVNSAVLGLVYTFSKLIKGYYAELQVISAVCFSSSLFNAPLFISFFSGGICILFFLLLFDRVRT